jgi:hypothetical protein
MVQTRLGRWGVFWGRASGREVVTAAKMPAPAGEQRVEPDGGVTLNRLLAMARLTPAQALALATDVLTGLEESSSAERPTSVLGSRVVQVTTDGRARVVGDGRPCDVTAQAGVRAGDLAAVAVLLGDLQAATCPSARDSDLVAALDRAAAEARQPEGRVAIVAATLRAADAPRGAQARAELARLVSAASGSAPGAAATRTAAPPPTERPVPERSRRRRPTAARAMVAHSAAVHPVTRRTWGWILSVVTLIVVVLTEIFFLRESIERDIQAVLEAGRSRPSSTVAPVLPPVVPPAPAAVGTIAYVDLRPVERCSPGTSCALRTHVRLQPQAGPQTVTWAFQVLDRCAGTATTVPGGTVTVPPNADRTDVVTNVMLPTAPALAVLALTSQPFRAASEPVYVPVDGACVS